MANVALRCTDHACSAYGRVQTGTTCAVCGKATTWTVLRVPPPGAPGVIGPIYTTPMPPKPGPRTAAVGRATRTCTNEGCPRYHVAQDDPFCGACGTATVEAETR